MTDIPFTEDLTEQMLREERWKRLSKPQERSTGRAQWIKRPTEHSGAALVLQHEWVISVWTNGVWETRNEWRDVPVVDE